MSQRLKKQVEKILDEGTGDRRNVIIKLASSEDAVASLLRTASAATGRRNLAISARDMLPAPFKETELPPAGKRSPAKKRRLLEFSAGTAAQIVAASLGIASSVDMLNAATLGLTALLDSDIVKRSIAQTSGSAETGAPGLRQPRTFWISKSAVLDIAKDDLQKLSEEVPQIQSIYPNRTLRLPPIVETQRLPANVEDNKTSAWGVHAIGALASWGAFGARGQGIKVGLLDTGVDASHPDLQGKIAAWAEFDANGDEVPGSQPHDTDGHGTHCAGTIVGGNASGQWIGVAPEAEIAAALVLNGDQGGTDAQIQAGIQWAAEQNVDVISLSLGGLWFGTEVPDFYTDSILSCLRLGIPVVVSIGNHGHQTTGTPGNDFFAYSIGATDSTDRIAGFSGGRTHIIQDSDYLPSDILPLVYSKPDISAPGVAIKSSVPEGDWKTYNGTSMAAPHVAGAIALLLSATSIKQSLTPLERAFVVQDLLSGSVEELGESGQDHRFGLGRIDVMRAIGFAKQLGY